MDGDGIFFSVGFKSGEVRACIERGRLCGGRRAINSYVVAGPLAK